MTFNQATAFTAGREGRKIKYIGIHWMVGTLASSNNLFTSLTAKTSAHVGVEDRNIIEWVRKQNTAYAVGGWVGNTESYSIEISAAPGRAPSDASYETVVNICVNICREEGLGENCIRPHSSWSATRCPGLGEPGGVDIERIKRGVAAILRPPTPEPIQPPPPPVEGVGSVENYTVVFGNTFNAVAFWLGTTPALFRLANPGIDYDNLRVGQVLRIPSLHHVTQPGENLSRIAQIHGITLDQVKQVNRHITAPFIIQVGRLINVVRRS